MEWVTSAQEGIDNNQMRHWISVLLRPLGARARARARTPNSFDAPHEDLLNDQVREPCPVSIGHCDIIMM